MINMSNPAASGSGKGKHMEQTTKKPTALLLGGGGAKGSFQIGAWQALAEAGLLTEIRMAAGCSVGALNAVLFALGDWQFARQIWEQIQPSDLLAKGADGAFFSREGLIRILDTLPLENLRTSPVRVTVSVHDIANNQARFYELNDLPRDEMRTLLLASSAIPRIYTAEYYQGRQLMDGGVTPEGDLCIAPAYENGHRNMLMISLRPKLSLYGGTSVGNGNLTEEYPDADFMVVKPMRPMGNLLTGTLNFAPERVRVRMQEGYSDAQNFLSGMRIRPQTPEEMNAVLTEKMQRLFPNGRILEMFLQKYGGRLAPNVPLPTLGGNVWYDNVFEVDGWRLQQQRTAGLQSHYRFLDPQNVRAGWVLQPQQLLDTLAEYEAALELERNR